MARQLSYLPDFGAVAMAVVLSSGKKAWVSSRPEVSLAATHLGFSRAEMLFSYNFLCEERVIFPDEFIAIDEVQISINKLIESYGIYRGYCYTRVCDDCSIIVCYYTARKITNYHEIYAATYDVVKKFAVNFLDALLPQFILALPEIKASRFATDATYRQKILLQGSGMRNYQYHLTEKEIAILYWSARGKTAGEIAIILGLTKNTIDTYRRSLLDKMAVSNITHAVHIATIAGLII